MDIRTNMDSKLFFYKATAILIAACIASLGTMPYGFKFTHVLALQSHSLSIFIGIVLAFSAAIANTALGAYSLMSINTKQSIINPFYLACASLLSAIPNGFMCFFGYQHMIPNSINLLMSCTVTLINAAIAYTAILNFALEIKSVRMQQIIYSEIVFRILGLVIGFCVSTTVYMASIQGLTSIFLASHRDHQTAFLSAYIIGFLTWLPTAALYANTMQITFARLYQILTNFSGHISSLNRIDILLLLFAFCSGASFAQIAMDFFNPVMNIPPLLKLIPVQTFIYHFLIPLAFISSAAVNYFALKKIMTMRDCI